METIAVIGLGIIGGSICATLSKKGKNVYGYDLDETVVQRALDKGYIVGKAEDFSKFDVVFIAVPASATLSILDSEKFKDGALVMDICGIKKSVEKVVYSKPRNYKYVGLHPMAGKETSGLDSATDKLFYGANLVITLAENTDPEMLEKAICFSKELGFSNIVRCTADEHDKKIALTSQLAHLVSNAYVKSSQVIGCEPFTGGSFQDMTRIAGVDEKMWTQLYLLNAENIVAELDTLIGHLQEYKNAISETNKEELSELLKEGRVIREKIKRKNR